MSRSTGTGDKRLAQRYAMKWTAEAKENFDELRNGKVASRAEMVAVARRVLAEELRNVKLEAEQHPKNFDAAVDAQMDNWRGIIDPEYMPPDTKVVHGHVDETIRRYGPPAISVTTAGEGPLWIRAVTYRMRPLRSSPS